MRYFFAVLFCLLAVLVPILLTVVDAEEVKAIDISAIKAERIVAGVNIMEPDLESRLSTFFGESYDFVLVGVDGRDVVYLGEKDGLWHKSWEEIDFGIIQRAVDVRIDYQASVLVVTCAKHIGVVILISVFSFFVFIIIGLIFLLRD